MKKRTLWTHWSFFKAGQGCFYAGAINTWKSAPFIFVYDCGSTQGSAILKNEIKTFKNYIKQHAKDTINLLMLSHLDADHINQVSNLLQGVTCELAVLPYLYPMERLYLYFDAGFDDSTDDDLFRQFVVDPAGFLIERGVRRVIFIDGNDETGNLIYTPVEPLSPDQETFQNGSDSENEDLFELNLLLEDADYRDDKFEFVNWNKYQEQVEIKKGNGGIRAGRFWEFYLYQVTQRPDDIDNFRDQVESRFGITLTRGMLQPDDLKTIFSDDFEVNTFKKLFKSIFKETNSTGLIVMHGAMGQYMNTLLTGLNVYSDKYIYTLLTGDTDMHEGYPVYIKDRLPQTKVMQIPHHGSAKNWDVNKILTLSEAWLVLNYGTANSYGHPDPSLTTDIMSMLSGREIVHNTELNDFFYEILVYYGASTTYPELAPFGRSHLPVITTIEYRSIDDQDNLGYWTDARALSLGRSTWDTNEFSVKVWRHKGTHWSRQSEEIPMHRALDMAILVISGIIERQSGWLPDHHLQPEIILPAEMNALHDFLDERKEILDERLLELRALLARYLVHDLTLLKIHFS